MAIKKPFLSALKALKDQGNQPRLNYYTNLLKKKLPKM